MGEKNFENLAEGFYHELLKIESYREKFKLISDLQMQVEGWFKTEFLYYLKGKKMDIGVENRECKVSEEIRRKTDIRIPLKNYNCYVELKHIILGEQKGSRYNLKFYFYEKTYISNDIEKLQNIKSPDEAYALTFVSLNEYKNEKKLKEELKEDLQKILKELKDKEKISSSEPICFFDQNSNFGYFLIKVK